MHFKGQADTSFNDITFYEPTDYFLLRRFIRPLAPKRDDVVYEIGCGLGRTACMFARWTISRCVGIECVPELARGAQINADRLRGKRSPIEIRIEDAARADYSDGTIFWLNNPFGPQTLRTVLRRIRCSLRKNPRRIRFVYVNPQHATVFDECRWLQQVHREQSILYGTSQAMYWSSDQTRRAGVRT